MRIAEQQVFFKQAWLQIDNYDVTFFILQEEYTLRKTRETIHTEGKEDEYDAVSPEKMLEYCNQLILMN